MYWQHSRSRAFRSRAINNYRGHFWIVEVLMFYHDIQELNQWEKILQGKLKKNKFSSPLTIKDGAMPCSMQLPIDNLSVTVRENSKGELRYIVDHHIPNEVILFSGFPLSILAYIRLLWLACIQPKKKPSDSQYFCMICFLIIVSRNAEMTKKVRWGSQLWREQLAWAIESTELWTFRYLEILWRWDEKQKCYEEMQSSGGSRLFRNHIPIRLSGSLTTILISYCWIEIASSTSFDKWSRGAFGPFSDSPDPF